MFVTRSMGLKEKWAVLRLQEELTFLNSVEEER